MNVQSLSQYLNQLEVQKLDRTKETQKSEGSQNYENQFADYYDQYMSQININDQSHPMPSGTYDQTGRQQQDQNQPPVMPDLPERNDVSQTSDLQSVNESVGTIMNQISQNLRVNNSTIMNAMDDLGLTSSDLFDSDSLEKLSDYLNSGAEALGLQTVDNLDDVKSDLTTSAKTLSDQLQNEYSLDDTELEELLKKYEEQLKQMFIPFENPSVSDQQGQSEDKADSEAITSNEAYI